jgi:hypothetical protein
MKREISVTIRINDYSEAALPEASIMASKAQELKLDCDLSEVASASFDLFKQASRQLVSMLPRSD